MAGLKNTAASIAGSVSELSYRLRNLMTAMTPVHVVVCGPDDTVAMRLMEKLPGVFNPADVSVVWGQALWTKQVRSRVIISWDPDDASRADDIEHALSPTRRIVWVLAVGAPSELVSEPSNVLLHHFAQGADYRLHVDGQTRSFTQPGVISRSRDVLHIVNQYGSRAVVVKRDTLQSHPDQVFADITDVVVREDGPAPASQTALNSAASDTSLPARETAADQATRIASQRARFPELDDITAELGYPPLPAPVPGANVSARGLIVAFHTPDEIYKAEADRLRGSLDALGLQYLISVVEPESNWVRTTLLKPTWIAPARKTLRGPLLYVDVDAFVHADPWPYVTDMEADMAAVVYKNGQLNSATLWINDTPGAELILSSWAAGAGDRRGADRGDLEHTGDNGDQGVLKLVVEAEEQKPNPAFSFGRLPPNLATIFDRTDEYRYGDVAIEQLQVSREVTGRTKRLSRRHDRLKELSD
jgi:hypothetical protein